MSCEYCDFCLQDGDDGSEFYTGLRDIPIGIDVDGYVQLSLREDGAGRRAFMEMSLDCMAEPGGEAFDMDGFLEIRYCPMCGREL